MSLFPPDLILTLALGLGYLTVTPATPQGHQFLESWDGYDGESLVLDLTYQRGIEQEAAAVGLLVQVT